MTLKAILKISLILISGVFIFSSCTNSANEKKVVTEADSVNLESEDRNIPIEESENSTDNPDYYTFKGEKIPAEKLPPAGIYVYEGRNSYIIAAIKVIIENGNIRFQARDDESSFKDVDVEISYGEGYSPDFSSIYFLNDWGDFDYIGNGVLESFSTWFNGMSDRTTLFINKEIYQISHESIINESVNYDCFTDDNISIVESEKLTQKFLNGENHIPYNSYSDYKYTMNFNAPCADRNRSYEPSNVINGYQRLYFQNSENVYAQRKMQNNNVNEVIYFHPDGRIYTIKKVINNKINGRVKFVDLENHVFLQGEYRDDKLVGRWDTPIIGNFNVQDNSLISQYPGVVHQLLTFSNFYYYDKDGRRLKMQGY